MKFMQADQHGGTQSSVTRIVIHGTVSPCVEGGAANVARYFQSPSAGGSAHYIVDPGETVAAVRENVVAYHAPPNTGTIGVELCDSQTGPAARWGDDNHQRMLQRAAVLVRQIAARWDVPLRRLTVAEVKSGKRGICGHVDVSNAFRQTDHSDPGVAFPWAEFMQMVTGDAPAAVEKQTWMEKLMKDLPLLQLGSDGFDVKTVRWLLGARGRPPKDLFSTKFDPDLVADVKELQKAEDLDVDGIVGKDTWAALLRVA